MTQNILITICITFFLLPSCKKENINSELGNNIVVETSKNSDNDIIIIARTEKIFNCANYRIEYNLAKNDANFTINFLDVVKNDACLTAVAPASGLINFGKLDFLEYKIKFIHNNQTTNATLKVDSNQIELAVNAGNVKKKMDI